MNRAAIFFRRNAIPLAALFISICSLALTIATNQRDADYKEFGVTPKLSPVKSPDRALVVESNGLGPAIIEGVAVGFRDSCSTSFRPDDFEADGLRLLHAFADAVTDDIEKTFPTGFEAAAAKKAIVTFNTTFDLIRPGEYIQAGKDRRILDFSYVFAKPLNEIVSEFNFDPQRALRVAYSAHADELHLALFYCSVSGKLCYQTDFPAGARSKCKLHDFDLSKYKKR